MKYQNTAETAKKWGISPRTVRNFCAQDKIPGAVYSGKQWLIPTDAEPPADGRTKSARGKQPLTNYHFPVFIYSPYYNDTSELDENEQQLLAAEKLHLEGNFSESIKICRKLLLKNIPSHLIVGAHCTIGFSSLLLGINSEYKRSLEIMTAICSEETEHTEDFKLMIACLKFNADWNSKHILDINPNKLSPDSIYYYKYAILCISFFSNYATNKAIIQYINSDCIKLKKEGITPALFSFHCMLGGIRNMEISEEERERHIEEAVRLAVNNNWLSNLTKLYNSSPSLYDKYLEPYGKDCVTTVQTIHHRIMANWGVIHNFETGNYPILYTSNQLELLTLIFYDYSIDQISFVKSLTSNEIKQLIQEIRKIAGVETEAELYSYAKAFFNGAMKNPN